MKGFINEIVLISYVIQLPFLYGAQNETYIED